MLFDSCSLLLGFVDTIEQCSRLDRRGHTDVTVLLELGEGLVDSRRSLGSYLGGACSSFLGYCFLRSTGSGRRQFTTFSLFFLFKNSVNSK